MGKIIEKTAPIRAKIAEIAKKYGGKIVAVLQAIVDKYKDVIMDAVEKSGRVVIEEGKKIIIEVVKDTVKVIVDGIHALGGKYEITATSADESEENGLKEIWEQVKAAVEGYVRAYKEELKKLVTKYKPRIIAELKRAKKVVIDEGKQLVIDMLGDAIKIIIKSGVGYEPQENGLKEIWEQVKAAVEGYVGAYKEELKKLVTKYKPRIIAEL